MSDFLAGAKRSESYFRVTAAQAYVYTS